MQGIRRTLALAGLALAPLAQAQVEFPVSFSASAAELTVPERAAITAHVQAAGRDWASVMDLAGPRSIEVEIALAAIPRANGSSVTSVFVTNTAGRDVFEQSAAAELRSGIDPNPADPDVRINFGLDYLRNELWFDPDPGVRAVPVPVEKTDAMSVMLHELGHALAYNGWADGQGTSPSTYWSTFDRWMLPGAPVRFGGTAVVEAFGSAPELTTGNIHHWANGPAPMVKQARAFMPVRWEAGAPQPWPACDGMPSADAPPSRERGVAKGSLPPGLIYELMNGVVFYRGSRYEISPLDVAALRDSGLPVIEPLFSNGFEGS